MPFPSSTEIGTWVGTALAAIVGAFALWVKQSRARLDVKKNDSEGGWISRLEADRDQAILREREAVAKHLADQIELGNVRMRIALLLELAERQRKEIAMLRRIVLEQNPELRPLLDSEFGRLPDFSHEDPVLKRSRHLPPTLEDPAI